MLPAFGGINSSRLSAAGLIELPAELQGSVKYKRTIKFPAKFQLDNSTEKALFQTFCSNGTLDGAYRTNRHPLSSTMNKTFLCRQLADRGSCHWIAQIRVIWGLQ